MQRERQEVELPVVRFARKHGVLALKLNLQGRRGMPDDLFLFPGGRTLFIEFKAPGEQPTALQLFTHQQLRSLGYEVKVIDDPRIGIRCITEELEAARVPAEGDQVPAIKPRRRTVARPRNG